MSSQPRLIKGFYLDRLRLTVSALAVQDMAGERLNANYLSDLSSARDKSERKLVRSAYLQILCMGLLLIYVQGSSEGLEFLGIHLSEVKGYGELLLIFSSLNFSVFCYFTFDYALQSQAILGYIDGNLMRRGSASKTKLLAHALPHRLLGNLIYSDRSDEFFLAPTSPRFKAFLKLGRSLTSISIGSIVLTLVAFHIYSIYYVWQHNSINILLSSVACIVSAVFDLTGLFACIFHSVRFPFRALPLRDDRPSAPSPDA